MKRIVYVILYLYATAICAQNIQEDSKSPCQANLKVLPVLWHQHAAEYQALCYQAFNIASWRIDKMKLKPKRHRYAIITDIDETILDNSYYEAQRLKECKDFDAASWKKWTDKAAATAVPGAVEFLQRVKQKGISIFYLSNRGVGEVSSTMQNLQKLNLPDANTEHMIFMDGDASKEERRRKIMADYEVIMLLGDNLNDFTALFEKKSTAERNEEVTKARAEWGSKFIVLPNATYGEWENALYNYERGLSDEEKRARLNSQLIIIDP